MPPEPAPDGPATRTDGPPYRPGPPLDLLPADVVQPVRTLLGDPAARVTDVQATPIGYESWSRSSDGLYDVSGTARTAHGDRAWRLVLKQVSHRRWTPAPGDLARQMDDGGDAPGDWAYWRREALLLESGLLDRLPDGFAAPRCLATTPRGGAGQGLRLWLERVTGVPGDRWTADDLLTAAYDLGRCHARYLAEPPAPRPWFCRPFLEQRALIGRAALIGRVEEAAGTADPLLRRLFPRAAATALRTLWERHAQVVDLMRRLPHTLVHRDLTPGNLFRAPGRTVAIDWGQTGLGPAGEDLATLVLSSRPAGHLDAQGLADLGTAAAARHRAGLAEGGWHGDPETVAVAYRLVAAFHYGLPLARTADKLLALPPERRRVAAEDTGLRTRIATMIAHLETAQPDLRRLDTHVSAPSRRTCSGRTS
ncbi:phosphotransferase [Streptomyces sp. NPDC017673]|uniref:phosphotransferase n=1 Tax=unclassified Streptomyces TaxID=2593676 RepID=UPI0037ADADDC